MITRLWIGGSSGLAQTYFNNAASFEDPSEANDSGGDVRWILVGLEPQAPHWMPATQSFEYQCCNLTESSSIEKLVSEVLPPNVDDVVLAVRPALVTPLTHAQAFLHARRLAEGFLKLLELLIPHKGPALVIHVSSIASIDHLNRQSLRSETSEPDPPSSYLKYPYDWFKRRCEEEVIRVCSSASVPYTNLRLGAIFSDSRTCIQCGALQLQSLVGPYLTLPIDCNSSRNVCSLIHQILLLSSRRRRGRSSQNSLRPVYYYTRPLMLPRPVPYGEYLVSYREAYRLSSYALWIPNLSVKAFVSFFHLVTTLVGSFAPYLQSVDYLLQVTTTEHSFDNSAVAADFGQAIEEESILECFERRRKLLNQQPPIKRKAS
jgi:hypothetical protein